MSFLPANEAGCVVDAVYEAAGTFNPNAPEAADVDQAALVAECTKMDEATAADENAPKPLEVIREYQVEPEPLPPFELTDETMPVINPGGRATGTVRLKGKNIDYIAITPPGFQIGDSAPVFFALPPGGQNLEITEAVAEFVYQQQAVARGWVVVSPAAPGRGWTSDAELAPHLVNWIQAWVDIDGGRPHVGGMSNGGRAAFAFAIDTPSLYQSIVVFPGMTTSADRDNLDRIAALPIRMWVGGDDPGWSEPMESITEELRTLQGDVELVVLPGEPHVLQSTTDGVAFFNALDQLNSTN